TAITASNNTPAFGETVTYTASVSANPPGTGAPADGTVTFRFNGGGGIKANVSNGQATITKQWMSAGPGHMVDASYNGDDSVGEFLGSIAPQVLVTVSRETTV